MVYIRSRKFCCCLPVRIGVFVCSFYALSSLLGIDEFSKLIGILGIVGGGVVAAAGWLEVKNLSEKSV